MTEAFWIVSIMAGVGSVCLLGAASVNAGAANWLAAKLRARAIYLEAMAKERAKHSEAAARERGRLMAEWGQA